MTPAKHSWKENQYQQREKQILQVAEAILLEKGYHATSMDEIAEHVGIARGTLYLHFSSKEDLVVALLGRDVELHLVAQLEETARSSSLSVRAKLETVLGFIYRNVYGKHLALLSLIYGVVDLIPVFAVQESIRLKKPWGAMTEILLSLVEEGKATGELDATIPTEVLLQMFLSFFSLKHYGALLVHHHMDPNDLVHALTRLYFQGAAGQPAPQREELPDAGQGEVWSPDQDEAESAHW
jgi:AcrR family transcriptional regulator